MGKINLQSTKVKKSEAEEIATLTAQTLAIGRANDKELTDEEKDYIRKAEKLNVRDFPIIHPLRATIGFIVRNMDGGNQQAIEFVRAGLPANTQQLGKNYLFTLVNEFDDLDEASQKRVDCLDHLCKRNKVGVMRFLEAMGEGVVVFHNQMTKILVAAKKPELAEKIIADAHKEGVKSVQNKRLAADIMGLTQKEPLVHVETGNKTTNNFNDNRTQVLTFTEFSKKNDKEIRGASPRLLEEGKQDYIEGEIVEEKEKELVER